MARTLAQIYDSLNVVKNNMTELQGYVTDVTASPLDDARHLAIDAASGSKVANWRLWLWIVAVASWVVENIFDNTVLTIQAILAQSRPHTLRWYEDQTRLWQYGYELAWLNDDHYGYAEIDTSARLAAEVSATENTATGAITLKVVKEDGGLTPLATLEQDSLAAFWARWKDAGVKIDIVSRPANVLNIQATVVRDRLILAADGTLLRDSATNTLTNALAAWLEALPFNGVIRVTDIEAAAKSAEGIKDFVISYLWIREGDGINWTAITREAVPSSGFAEIDYDESDFTYIDE